MKRKDTALTPQIAFISTKATIEAWTSPVSGMEAIATDTQERGAYIGSAWIWSALALGVPGAQTAKRVVISDASGALATSDYVAYDDSTKILTLGELIVGFYQSVIWNLSSGISRVLNMITWGAGNSTRFKGTFARGLIDAPTAVQSGDPLVRFSGAGYDGVTGIQNAATSAELKAEASENFDATHHGTNIGVWITKPGEIAMVRVGTFTDAGLNLEAGYEFLIDGVAIGGGGNGFQIDSSGGTSDTYGVLIGTIDGSNRIFTTSLGKIRLWWIDCVSEWTATTTRHCGELGGADPSTGTFQFNAGLAPVSGDIVDVFYKYANPSTTNADTLDGYEASAFATLALPMVRRGTVEVDFGTGDLYKSVNVTAALALPTSIITANISYEPTLNNSADDIMAQPMEIKIGNRGTGDFDVMVLSLLGKVVGKVNVDYILMN